MTDNNIKIDYQIMDFDNFDDFLYEYHNGNLIRGIYEYGFERPSPIQSKAIKPICDGRDVIAQAQSGTGKTGAFVLGALSRVDPISKYPQIVMIANTRELATQIYNVVKNLSIHLNINISLCIGGQGGKDVMSNLHDAYESHILVGTPGRLVDLIERDERRHNKSKLLDRLKLLILDEADILLADDFINQIQTIIRIINKESQICIFSATYPPHILSLTEKFMNNPVRILVEREKVSVDVIKNYYVDSQYEDNKYDILVELYQKVSVCQAVIFVNSINKAIEVSERLKQDGHSVGTIHSKLDDSERSDILKGFRLTQTRILVATDIISRGIDVQQVGLIINYDIPYEAEQYIHRVGRSGRYGKLGVAITLVTNHRADIGRMTQIEKKYGIKFTSLPSLDTVNNYLTGLKGYNYIDISKQEN